MSHHESLYSEIKMQENRKKQKTESREASRSSVINVAVVKRESNKHSPTIMTL